MLPFRTSLFLIAILIVISSCTRIPQANEEWVSSVVEQRLQKSVQWNEKSGENDEIERTINCLLEQELSVDSAVQVALLNNPIIQAIFEEIGISHADLIEAGLLHNPVLDGLIRFPFPHQKGATLNTEFSIVQNFLDLLLIPLRKKIAAAEYEQTQLKVANAVFNLAFDVQETFYSLQAQQAKLDLMFPSVEAADASSELAKRQQQQGNINELEFQGHLNEFLESKIELASSQIEIIRLRERMNKLLGLQSSEICWHISNNLPPIPSEEFSDNCLIDIALSQRLDLQIAKWEVEKIARMYGIKQWWAYTAASLGISTERDSEGIRNLGPAFSFELPLFNYGQADRARIQALFRQSLDRLEAKEIEIASEVRSAQKQVLKYRELLLSYQNELLPLQKRILAMSQRYYNFMTLSVYKLLQAKKQELHMQINFHLTLRDYWLSRVALDRALGGNLY